MRGATLCARRVKALFGSLRSKLGKVSLPGPGDPLTQCILGILSRDVPEPKAREALDRIRGMVVDFNELRVVPPIELAQMLGDYPDVRLKCEDISRALNKIFALHHNVTLDHLLGMPKKEVIIYLSGLDGLEDYTRARIRLLALQQHAVPLDEAMWAYARQQEIIDPRCQLGEAQPFLERQVSEGDALEFYVLLNRQAWAEMGTAVRKRQVARILSVPPDRTTRNMLQAIGAGAEVDEPVLVDEDLELEPLADEAPPPPEPVKPAAAETPPRKRRPQRPAPARPAKQKPPAAKRKAPAAKAAPSKAPERRKPAKAPRAKAAKAKP